MNKQTEIDKFYIKKVIQLARKAEGKTSPNPLVGAFIVKDGTIVGKGYHHYFGGPHAEIYALQEAGEKAKGATLYVNLEPCNHYGKTPPCVDRVIESGIARVVISNRDPNPQVNGGGVQKLMDAGIDVTLNIEEAAGKSLNEAYFHFVQHKKPFVILKWAQSLDGRIATKTRESHWISNEKSRKFVHQLRNRVDAILIGVGTVNQDNPQLTVRHVKGNQPWRLVLDQKLEIDPDTQILHDDYADKTVIFTTNEANSKIRKIEKSGTEVVVLPVDHTGRINLEKISQWLINHQMISLLVEGGQEVLTSYIRSGITNKVYVFIAPKVLGDGVNAIGDLGILSMKKIVQLQNVQIRRFGTDTLIEAYINGETCLPD